MLLGLKSDLRQSRNCIELLKAQGLTPVTQEQGRAVAQRMGALYMECSAREYTGVNEIFDKAITMAVSGKYEDIQDKDKGTPRNGPGENLSLIHI